MMRSMFAGVSGLRSHQIMMDVVGNNIANVNTVGFKASRVLFQDALSQMIRGSSGGTGEATAGVNPQQVGLGVKIASTDTLFAQGGSQLTGRSTDVAIQGDGFFATRVGNETLYTRSGAFTFDQQGFLTDSSGGVVQGWIADPNGAISTTSPVQDIQIPIGKSIAPVPSTTVRMGGNLSVDALVTDPPVLNAIDVIDALGSKQRVSFEFTKTGPNAWDMEVLDPTGASIGTTGLTFDPSTGALTAPAVPPSFTFTPTSGAANLTFTVDFSGGNGAPPLTQFGGTSDAAAVSQDGSGLGLLRAFAISDDGILSAVFSNGRSQAMARLGLASFTNPGGLIRAGDSRFRASNGSGQALIGPTGSAGRGTMSAGTLEMSNVELAQEFTNLIVAQRGFQANSRIITTSDEILQELVNLKR